MPPWVDDETLKAADQSSLLRTSGPLIQRVRDIVSQAQQPVEQALPSTPAVDFEGIKNRLLSSWTDQPASGGAPSTSTTTQDGRQMASSPLALNSPPVGSRSSQPTTTTAPSAQTTSQMSPFDLPAHAKSLLAMWDTPKPQDTSSVEPGSTPPGSAVSSAPAGASPPAGAQPAAMPTVQAPSGPIDNSSRDAFVKTAYPAALQAADGDPVLAQQLLATAISENGKVGTGRDLGEMGNNVGGIQGVEGSAGSFTAMDAGRPRQFAAYNNLAEGFRAVRDLVSGGRYAPAAENYQQTKDIDRYWREVNEAGYSETPDWQDRIAAIRRTQVEPLTRGLSTPPASPGAVTVQPSAMPQGQAATAAPSSYTQQGLADAGDPDAWAKCGPVAAYQFALRTGRSPNPSEVEKLAKDAGWTPQLGMAGFQSEAKVLAGLGIAAKAEDGVDWDKVITDVSRGNPVLLQLPGHEGHYITAQGYDPKTGKIDFGSTVGDLRAAGHKTQFTPSELENLGWGTPTAALYLDNPATPAPSAVAGPSQPVAAAAPSTGGPPWTSNPATTAQRPGSATQSPQSTSTPPAAPTTQPGSSPASQASSPDLMLRQPLSPTSGPDTLSATSTQPSGSDSVPTWQDSQTEPASPDPLAAAASWSQPYPLQANNGPMNRFIPEPYYVHTGQALAGAPIEGSARPYPTNVRNRAVAGTVDETTDPNAPQVPPPSPDGRNMAVPGQVREWYEQPPEPGSTDETVAMPIRPGYQAPWTTNIPQVPQTNDNGANQGMSYRMPLTPTSGPDTFPTDAPAGEAGASAPGPGAPPTPAPQVIPNEDQTSYGPAPQPSGQPGIVDTSGPEQGPQQPPFHPLYDLAGNIKGYVENAAPTLSSALDAAHLPNPIAAAGMVPAAASTVANEGIATPIARAISNPIREVMGKAPEPDTGQPETPIDRALVETGRSIGQDVEHIRSGAPGSVVQGAIGLVGDLAPTTTLARQLNEMFPKADVPYLGETGVGDVVMGAQLVHDGWRLGYGTVKVGGHVWSKIADAIEAGVPAERFSEWMNGAAGAIDSGIEAVRSPGARVASGDASPALANAVPSEPTRFGPAMNAAAIAAPGRAIATMGPGAVAGGAAGYASSPEDASPEETAARTVLGAGAGTLAATGIAGLGTLAAGRLVDSLVERGAINARILATHPKTADRIRALFSVAADGLPDNHVVPVPDMVQAMVRMRPQIGEKVADLLSGPVTAGDVRRIVGSADAPGIGQTLTEMAVDAMTGLGARGRRGRELEADAATVRGISQEAQRAMSGRAASALPTLDTQNGPARLVDPSTSPSLTNFVNGVADKLGVARPGVYLAPSSAVNASATTNGRAPAIILTRGLLDADLTDNEMAAVLTHELAHTAQDSRSLVGRAFGAVRDALSPGERETAGALPEERQLGFQSEQQRLREQNAQESERTSAAQMRLIGDDPLQRGPGMPGEAPRGPEAGIAQPEASRFRTSGQLPMEGMPNDPLQQGPSGMAPITGAPRLPAAVERAQALATRQAQAAERAGRPAPPSAWDWIKAAGYAGIYSPATAVSSAVGGATELVLAQPKEAIRALVQGRPGAYGAQVRAQIGALSESLPGVWRVLTGDAAGSAAASGGSQGTAGLSERVSNPVGHFAARSLEKPGEILTEAPDAVFRPLFLAQGATRAAQQVASELGMRGPHASSYVQRLMQDAESVKAGQLPTMPETQRVLDAGEKYADQLGYKGKPGGFGQWLGKQSKRDDAIGVAASFLMPFPSMAARMSEAAVKVTPGSALLPGVRKMYPSKFDMIYDQTLGAVAASGVAYWAMNGGITGSGPTDKGERDAMITQGWQPNSTLVWGHYIPNRMLSRFQPMLDTAGELHDALAYGKKDRSAPEIATDLAKRASKIATDQVGLSGLADLHDMLANGFASQLPGFAARSITRYVPYGGVFRAAAASLDPASRRADKWSADNPLLPAIGEQLKTAVPGLRQTVPAAQDTLGRPAENPQQGLGAFIPRTTTARTDPTIRLFQDAGVDIGAPRDKITVGRVAGVEIKPAEQRRWNELRGQFIQDYADAYTGNADFMALPPAQKQKYLTTFLGKAADYADKVLQSEMDADDLTNRTTDAAMKKAS